MNDLYSPVLFAGDLNRRIVIEKSRQVDDGLSSAQDWSDAPMATVWANVRELSGSESLLASQVYAVALTRFQIRYRGDLSVKCRIIYMERIYDITSISEIGVQEGLEIMATVHVE